MPDANGNLRGISLSGRAGEAWERIFNPPRDLSAVAKVIAALREVPDVEEAEGPFASPRSPFGI